ncbi:MULTISPECIES: SMEK domain-containing protein [Paenibacillus]|uniref:SMEK domain-containing protein n=1 Tax=Paenibacillus vandeheii TaxID=3035917 RepID=A0ABT8JFP3_9BACL|nr:MULTISPECIES: SMEK domain-containing protein [Paenibacillus]MDN4603904.1 SMEK domain-containing protein [Paenibacillus vandeheii]
MLTRGKILGDILDGLGQLSFVLQTRSSLGLTDLNKYCEDFIKELVNLIYGYNLVNLNTSRSNEPGLDLGDEVQRLGIQVTTDKSSSKVNLTLEKITTDQKSRYDRYIILILGSKQRSYSINSELATELQFVAENDIWDFNDLERILLTLPVEKVKQVYDLLQSDLIRLFSDFEIGTTPSGESTSLLDRLEQRPTYLYNGCERLVEHINQKETVSLNIPIINEAFNRLIKQLSELPRITREFFYALLVRSEYVKGKDALGIRETLIRRLLPISETRFNEELDLLSAYDLAYLEEVNDNDYRILFSGVCLNEHCLLNLLHYTRDNDYDLKSIIVNLDFSCLG